MYCKKCGLQIDDAKVCPYCGTTKKTSKPKKKTSKPKEKGSIKTKLFLLFMLVLMIGLIVGIGMIGIPMRYIVKGIEGYELETPSGVTYNLTNKNIKWIKGMKFSWNRSEVWSEKVTTINVKGEVTLQVENIKASGPIEVVVTKTNKEEPVKTVDLQLNYKPGDGVTEEQIQQDVLKQTLQIQEGMLWPVAEKTLTEAKIKKTELDLKEGTSIITIQLELTDDVLTAKGIMKMNYVFRDSKWTLDSYDLGTFKVK